MSETTRDQSYYYDLVDKAERGELVGDPSSILRGEEAAAAGRELLMWATETTDPAEAARVALSSLRGRPRLSPGLGRSPVIHARLDAELLAALDARARDTHKSRSEVTREILREALAPA
ncbi:MAG: ribbon-helix-helix domain-containing protein [Bifidobacteriaceae bacterium]|jgi:hypothetical protein|nr:ribbon-helix-helix domain-containing protein [Bifidobacteriaceae bacterium]